MGTSLDSSLGNVAPTWCNRSPDSVPTPEDVWFEFVMLDGDPTGAYHNGTGPGGGAGGIPEGGGKGRSNAARKRSVGWVKSGNRKIGTGGKTGGSEVSGQTWKGGINGWMGSQSAGKKTGTSETTRRLMMGAGSDPRGGEDSGKGARAKLRIVRQISNTTHDEAVHYFLPENLPFVGDGDFSHQVYQGPQEFSIDAWEFDSLRLPGMV